MIDVLDNVKTKEIKIADHGFVRLVDCMPRLVPDGQTADSAIVQAARVSYGEGTKKVNEDRGLIRYLMRHKHTTPLEMVEFKFHCSMEMFTARQWIRHRTASVNEYSARYSIVPDMCYIPNKYNVRQQSAHNKQVSEGQVSEIDTETFINLIEQTSQQAYRNYQASLDSGIGREQARMFLPLNYYTQWYWKIDLHNLLHFLALRCDSHAQQEIRVYGDAILELITPIVPLTMEAWNDYHPMRNAVTFSKLELECLKEYISPTIKSSAIDTKNKREQQEWKDKLSHLI